MRKLLILLIPLLLITACSIPLEPRPTATVSPPEPLPTEPPLFTNTPIVTPYPTAGGDTVHRYLFLGGDYRASRAGTEYGDKTDVMLLVQVRYNKDADNPARIDVIQFPRNFYTGVEAMDDMWLFHVWGKEGWPGLHYYFQQVFDVDLDGIFYVNMDRFVIFIDQIAPNGIMSDLGYLGGEDLLAYLRDNDNNWGCPEYDCGDRQMRTLLHIAEHIKGMIKDDPFSIFGLWEDLGWLFETDLTTLEQIEQGGHIAIDLIGRNYQVHVHKMTEAEGTVYNDTELNARGWVIAEGGDLPTWIQSILR